MGFRQWNIQLPMTRRPKTWPDGSRKPGSSTRSSGSMRATQTAAKKDWPFSLNGATSTVERTKVHWDCYVDNLAYAAETAEARGITILVEAMSASAVPDYFIDTPDLGAKAIAATGLSNLRLLLDVFHTVTGGLDIYEQIDKHADLLGHVHIADYPGRHEPGTGTLDFDQIRGALTRAGYNGWLGCEYIPAGRTDEGLTWYLELRPPADSVPEIG
jgi:hydroxypyruvate isomerase